ncbi:MAG TPA: biotin-dependent carboxyltransferase family protein [Burkholderiales bacterium]|nr:biotin-dependent carboxyltransferase family protein [Burkholderiales bacterium]
MSLRIAKPGLLTTVQDRGRHGLQHLGVVTSGAMDPAAYELANALVGNRDGEAALEVTLLGPTIELGCDALVALCGAEFEAEVEGAKFPADRPVLVKAGSRVAMRRAVRGTRAYLAIAGGIAIEPLLASRSTCLPAGFGGFGGRALRSGDVLPLAADAAQLASERYQRLASRAGIRDGVSSVRWSAPTPTLPDHQPIVLHAMPGRHYDDFDAQAQRAFFDLAWRISPDSDRMGFRLTGPQLARARGGEILSEPTCLGTVQVPANGAPIVLMADHQTTGGYPKIAEVAGADVARLAQLAPGASVRFARCTLAEALELRAALKARIDAALRGISWEYDE